MTENPIPPPLSPEELRAKLQSGDMKVVFAPQDNVDVYDKEVHSLLVVIGAYMVDEDGDPEEWAEHCYVSDMSQMGDFMPFDFSPSPANESRESNRRVREESLAEISQKLGFSVTSQDYIWEVAAKMRGVQ